jgi:hypothetical protein
MIEAGQKSEIVWGNGNWIFLDIGFSGQRNARGRTCGLVMGDGEPETVDFAEATKRIVGHVVQARSPSNLVIEAPLSVCFSRSGNPTGRSIERKEGKPRYWFTGPGCAVMVASMYLIRAISDAQPLCAVRLFEAFLSYKEPGAKSDHRREARMLQDVVRHPQDFAGRIVSSEELKVNAGDELSSAFRVIGLDCGVPAVIML